MATLYRGYSYDVGKVRDELFTQGAREPDKEQR